MPVYKRVFSVADVGRIQNTILASIRVAQALERLEPGRHQATIRLLRSDLLELNNGLERIARETAVEADRAIRRYLTKTKSGRPNTGNQPGLRDAIKSRPVLTATRVATGQVGVADIERLDSLVNPTGPQYGPYWRAQEEGTTHQKGRVVYGGFYGTGLEPGPFKPDPSSAGQHPIFVSTRAARGAFAAVGFSGGPGAKGGAGGGKMTIGRELKARHFIRDGANEAEAKWRADIARLERKIAGSQAVIARPSFGRRRRRA